MNFITPWVLIFLPLAIIPLIISQSNQNIYSWNEMIPLDVLSKITSILLKSLSSLIIFIIILALSEPYSNQKVVSKIGEGAQIGLVLDRSASMDEPFSGGDDDTVGETKSAAASRLIIDFFESRSNDMVGVITFSNSAMYVLPLTQNKDAIKAAVNATAGNALFQSAREN